jgi:hypothetical protein
MRYHLLFFCIFQVFEGTLFVALMIENYEIKDYADSPKQTIAIYCTTIAVYTSFCAGQVYIAYLINKYA